MHLFDIYDFLQANSYVIIAGTPVSHMQSALTIASRYTFTAIAAKDIAFMMPPGWLITLLTMMGRVLELLTMILFH